MKQARKQAHDEGVGEVWKWAGKSLCGRKKDPLPCAPGGRTETRLADPSRIGRPAWLVRGNKFGNLLGGSETCRTPRWPRRLWLWPVARRLAAHSAGRVRVLLDPTLQPCWDAAKRVSEGMLGRSCSQRI